MPAYAAALEMPLRSHGFRPVGDTDSEHAFCVLLERMAQTRGGEQLLVADAPAVVVAPLPSSEETTGDQADSAATDSDADDQKAIADKGKDNAFDG